MTTLTLQERFHRFLHEMPFESQNQAAFLYRFLIILTAIISYVVAYFFQKFSYCIYSIIVASVICLIVITPGGWPWWKRPLPTFAKSKKQ